MKVKTILSIVAFSTAFAFSAAFAGLFTPANTTADRITEFVNQDVYNGREHTWIMYRIMRDTPRVSEHSAYPEYINAVNAYVETFPAMDASQMPRDFRLAWRKHTRAWNDYSAFINGEKSAATVYGFYADYELTEAAYTREIDETWDEVMRSARKHGSNARGY